MSTHTPTPFPVLHSSILVCIVGQAPLCEAPTAEGSRGSGPKGAGQEDRGGYGGGGGVCFAGWVGALCLVGVCFSSSASMREKGLAGAGGAQGRDAMALKLLFWELEKHLKR